MHDEFMAADRDRLIGLAQMPGVDTATAVKWLRDAKSAGYRGVIISAFPSGEPDLSAEDDPFWEVAEEEEMPIHIHSGLRQAGKRKSAGSFQQAAASFGREIGLAEMGGPVGDASQFMSKFIYSGLFDRFPGLQMVAVECGVGWIPHFLEHMDDHYWRNRTWTKSPLRMLPSDYFRQNWKATFIREPFAVATRHWIGVDNMMWSTDYPHHRPDWPYSRRIIEDSMGGVPEAERRRMVCENARELYKLG
jgi:predicted TIM-barrel fold metal-dependent hydrolase